MQLRLHNDRNIHMTRFLPASKKDSVQRDSKGASADACLENFHKFRNSFVQGSLWLYYGIPLFKKFNMAIPIIYRALGIKTGRNSTDFIDTEFTCQSDSDNKKARNRGFSTLSFLLLHQYLSKAHLKMACRDTRSSQSLDSDHHTVRCSAFKIMLHQRIQQLIPVDPAD